MKYRGGDIPEGINVTPTHPLKEFAILVGASIGLVLLLFWLLGEIAERAVMHLPPRYEKQLSGWYAKAFAKETKNPDLLAATQYIQGKLNQLTDKMADKSLVYTVSIDCSKQINAFAVPGGGIVILSQLLKKLKSEEELLMLLGHELGHHHNRDHLRNLGRALALILPLLMLGVADESGIASSLGNLTSNLLFLHHSRAAEEAADDFGMQLLRQTNANAAVGIQLFDTLQLENKTINEIIDKIPSFALTHPKSAERKIRLQDQFSAIQLKSNGTPLPKQLFTKICT